MDALISDFYVTLPSNASMDYFAENTPSSYRTKLHAPLHFTGDWEVALVECFIPRNWFNIGVHNNDYVITIETEKNIYEYAKRYDVTFEYDPNKEAINFFTELNENIRRTTDLENSISFAFERDELTIVVNISNGFELEITKARCPALLRMLNLPNEDIVIKTTTQYEFGAILVGERNQIFSIINKNPTSVNNHSIPLMEISEFSNPLEDKKRVFALGPLIRNINHLQLQDYLSITYIPFKKELEIKVYKHAVLIITAQKAESFLKVLNQKVDVVVTNKKKFKIDPLMAISDDESIDLIIKEFSKKKIY